MTLLAEHTRRLRTIRGLDTARHVFTPESNYAFEGLHAIEGLRRIGETPILIFEDMNRAGIRTNAPLKQVMAMGHSEAVRDGKVRFHKDFFTCDENMPIGDLKEEIRKQLKNYSRIVVPSRDPYAEPRIKWSGKANGLDDITISLQLNYVSKKIFMNSPKYAPDRNSTYIPVRTGLY